MIYAHVVNGVCDNVIVLDETTGYPMDNLIAITDDPGSPGVGWAYVNGVWSEPVVIGRMP